MADEIFDDDIYTLTDEDGVETRFELIGSCEVGGITYRALVPVPEEGEEDSDEYIILRCETDDDGEEFLVTIEDDEEFDRVADIFEDEFSDIYYDDDEEDE